MEKLINLLNEYEIWKTKDMVSQNPKRSRREWYRWQLGSIFWTLMNERESRLSIISKSYWFIQWLIENDKIDQFYYENSVRVKRYIDEYEEYDYVFPIDYKQLIMLLSIEDNPIEWLCSILK